MSPVKKSALRLVIYGIFVIYVLGDIFVFNGPIARRMEKANPFSDKSIADAKSRGVVARVFNHLITRDQLDRAVAERLWLSGQTYESLTPSLQKAVRYAALNDLIDHEILRVKCKVNATNLPASQEEVDARLQEFRKRFTSDEALISAMKSQGIANIQDLRDRLAARIQQEKYVALKIETMVDVDETTAKEWYAKNHRKLDIPERVHVRHIFLTAQENEKDAAIITLQTILNNLKSETPKSFASHAQSISQDPATKDSGGDLGWITRKRLSEDFTDPAFSLPTNTPSIIQTKIGWHLIEVIERRAASPQSFDAVKDEVVAALNATQHQAAAKTYRAALRQFEAEQIQVFNDMLE